MRRAPRCPSPLKCTWRTEHRNLLLQNCNAKIGRNIHATMEIIDFKKFRKLTDYRHFLFHAKLTIDQQRNMKG